ncbi:MAG: hypothetical protein Q9160_008354 [Pyrenula sp. 1 TL-2023]
MEYIYRRLEYPDAIRLLKFSGRSETSKDSLYRFSLITIRLSDRNRPRFRALSYTWGQNTDQRTILIDGTKVRIRFNLWTFIDRALRSRQLGISYLWVDALCISQIDLEEKAAQVQSIGETFRAADQVLAWLGNEEKQERTVLDSESKQLDRIFERACIASFWERTWIIQEILLAPQLLICYDEHVFSFEHFYELWKRNAQTLLRRHNSWAFRMCAFMLTHKNPPSRNGAENAGESGALTDSGRPLFDILNLISMFSHSACTVPLDKVYALLSLVDWQGRPPLQVNYELRAETLYFQTLSISRKVNSLEADYLRGALQIRKDQVITNSREVLRDKSISELDIKAEFEYSADNYVSVCWDLSQLPILYDESREGCYYLQCGCVQVEDILLEFSKTGVHLVFRKTVSTDKYDVKGIVLSVASEAWSPVITCPIDCVESFSDLKWHWNELASSMNSPEKTYLIVKPRAWLALCQHYWEIRLSGGRSRHQSKRKSRFDRAQMRLSAAFRSIRARLGGPRNDQIYDVPRNSNNRSPARNYEMTPAINSLGEARTAPIVRNSTDAG